MDLLTGDAETYYASDYSLKKIPPIQYIRDKRFKLHGWGLKMNDDPTIWLHKPADIKAFFRDVDWKNTLFNAFNTLFDGLILYEIHGHEAGMYSDGLALTRALLPPGVDYHLKDVAPLLGLGEKGNELSQTKGIVNLPPALLKILGGYCIQDTNLAHGIHRTLYPYLPETERKLLSITTRGGVVGRLCIDVPRAATELAAVKQKRKALFEASGQTEKDLRSRTKFPALLKSLDIEPPTKISKTTGKETYAFAKDDLEFLNLIMEHPEQRALFDAKMAASSSIEVSRTERFIDIGSIGCKTLPMPYKYYGAHTGRRSGTGKLNVQNLKRGGELRKSIIAPKGYKIVVADSSGIELRFNAWFSGQADTIQLILDGKDVYIAAASKALGIPYESITPDQRQLGKILELALGYNMGVQTFRRQLAVGILGLDPIYLSEYEAAQYVYGYRNTHTAIVDMWKQLQNRLPWMLEDNYSDPYKCVTFVKEGIVLPNTMLLQYPGLTVDENGWSYKGGKNNSYKGLYGGILLENITQAIANVAITEQAVIIDEHGLGEVVGSTHDEIIALAPDKDVEECFAHMVQTMSTPPAWAPDIPLNAEGGWATNYSK